MKQINSVTLGILFMLAFAITGPLIDLFAKLASAEVPIGQIILSRFILQGVVLLPVAIILSLAHRPTFKEFQMHFLRATLILFLFRDNPDSKHIKPACIKNTSIAHINNQNVSRLACKIASRRYSNAFKVLLVGS